MKLAVVTGAAGALGSAVLDDLTGRGWTVAAFDRPGERLDQAGQRDGVVPVPVDLLDRAAVRAAFEKVDGVGVPPVGCINAANRPDGSLHSGVIHQYADGAERLFCTREGGVDARAIGHVTNNGDGVAAVRLQVGGDLGDLAF